MTGFWCGLEFEAPDEITAKPIGTSNRASIGRTIGLWPLKKMDLGPQEGAVLRV